MRLRKWTAEISSGLIGFDPHLALRLLLECPVCGREVEVKTDDHSVASGVKNLISWKIQEAKELRICSYCGVPSYLIEEDIKRLTGEVTSLITDEWLKTAVKEMMLLENQ